MGYELGTPRGTQTKGSGPPVPLLRQFASQRDSTEGDPLESCPLVAISNLPRGSHTCKRSAPFVLTRPLARRCGRAAWSGRRLAGVGEPGDKTHGAVRSGRSSHRASALAGSLKTDGSDKSPAILRLVPSCQGWYDDGRCAALQSRVGRQPASPAAQSASRSMAGL